MRASGYEIGIADTCSRSLFLAFSHWCMQVYLLYSDAHEGFLVPFGIGPLECPGSTKITGNSLVEACTGMGWTVHLLKHVYSVPRHHREASLSRRGSPNSRQTSSASGMPKFH